MVLLGYEPNVKGYRLYNFKSRTIEKSRDVIFQETVFPRKPPTVTIELDSSDRLQEHKTTIPAPSSTVSRTVPVVLPSPFTPGTPIKQKQVKSTPPPKRLAPVRYDILPVESIAEEQEPASSLLPAIEEEQLVAQGPSHSKYQWNEDEDLWFGEITAPAPKAIPGSFPEQSPESPLANRSTQDQNRTREEVLNDFLDNLANLKGKDVPKDYRTDDYTSPLRRKKSHRRIPSEEEIEQDLEEEDMLGYDSDENEKITMKPSVQSQDMIL
ncbi:hypothetical protein M407DRAFT_31548 [Tulasnella calospora MUT 4182]|uniref:Retroviral polymerase SH3-like domain-containing protein n=1 Tax=Tulasnella calospora MUT 4182 TaxID=1051891 RepID=A0A0C3Q6A4_9AGAM|nr:hypothetical protein M407DRAFT_31548 [Tulasnella calospora MUT 4182]